MESGSIVDTEIDHSGWSPVKVITYVYVIFTCLLQFVSILKLSDDA